MSLRWRHASYALMLLACVATALAGAYLTVRAFATTVEPFTLGTVSVTAAPARDGRVDVYVPIVDWGVRASPYDAPLAVELRFRSLDRDEALAALRSGTAARERLAAIRTELAEVGRGALRRAALLGLAGGIGGGLLGGAVVGAALHRRRWLAFGAGVGLLVPVTFVAIVLATLREVDYEAFERPTFYAHGSELPRLLSFSGQLLTAGESYTESYEEALAGLANLVAFAPEGGAPPTSTTSFVLASDLHGNSLVLPVLAEYAEEKTVFLAGDFTLLGTTVESSLAPRVGRLGSEVVAVSGNHDSRPFMLALVRAGATVLTRDGRLLPDGSAGGDPVVEIDGLAVAGYDDPLEGESARVEERPLELSDEEFAEASLEFVAWFEGLPERPDVVLVHQHGLAHALLAALPEEDTEPLLILTGHDHEQHLHEEGAAVLVDGGTVGAGGPFAIGVQSVGFAEVHLTGTGDPRAVDLIAVEPLSGNARASRTALGAALLEE
jgi:Calcineurin-like phosphoesterase superfamily domain